MSRVHFKGIFVMQINDEVFYKYCPDTIYQKDVWGEFKFDVRDWQPLITKRAEPTGEIVVYVDEHCVSALTYKIKKHFEENKEFPNDVLFIA